MKFVISFLILFSILCQSKEKNSENKFLALRQINTIFGFLPKVEVGDAICYGDSTYVNSVWYQRDENNWNRYLICRFSDKSNAVFKISIRRGIDEEWKKSGKYRTTDFGAIYVYKVANCALWLNRFYTEPQDRHTYKWTEKRVESLNKFYHHIANILDQSGFCNE